MADKPDAIPQVSIVVDGQTFALNANVHKYNGGNGINANGRITHNGTPLFVSINCAPKRKTPRK